MRQPCSSVQHFIIFHSHYMCTGTWPGPKFNHSPCTMKDFYNHNLILLIQFLSVLLDFTYKSPLIIYVLLIPHSDHTYASTLLAAVISIWSSDCRYPHKIVMSACLVHHCLSCQHGTQYLHCTHLTHFPHKCFFFFFASQPQKLYCSATFHAPLKLMNSTQFYRDVIILPALAHVAVLLS